MNNYKLLIQYDGTNYSGWQIQQNAKSIQEEITNAIRIVTNENVNLIGSGRTDAGVHAFGQTANFRTELTLEPYKFLYSLNSILPRDIAVLKMEKVHEKFHSRFDAKKRSYIYFFIDYKSPFYYKYSYLYKKKLDCGILNELSKVLKGKKDFAAFAKKINEIENTFCTIHDIHWRKSKELIIFYIEADRFLHGMVRTIAGTILELYDNKKDKKELEKIINSKDRTEAGISLPPAGLFLYKVKY